MKRKKDYYKKPSRWKIRHTKQLNRSMAGNTILFVIMGICGVFMALPLVMILNNALKPLDELFRYPPQIFVRNPSLDNFSDLYVLMSSSWVICKNPRSGECRSSSQRSTIRSKLLPK